MIIKCKMCGGDVQFQQGDTVGQCNYCGSSCTIPKVDEEQKLNRYNRANHFRRQCEFDKAITAYERILEEDDTDAEAHWGIVLSRFGIEYVEDPATKRRVPTCHRVQVESILADADYQAALKNAPDTLSRNLYEEQAKEIAEIQKGILAISQTEKPYDVFICYKESDENNQRTRDSALAQEIYYGLTEQGYKVFFSRITLEDKLGQQYEPYIFAALNSAKVMIVVGTKPEYFNAVWVKNEWSRYLHLMKNDRERLLIPCYRDMDPYDLPDELSNLQSQDMGKIGFIQDLLRGIKKVLSSDSGESLTIEKAQRINLAEPNENALLDRAQFALEDGEFQKADEFIEQALNINARNSQAYILKLLVERKLCIESDIEKETIDLEVSPNYTKALRFADNETRDKLISWSNAVKKRIEDNKKLVLLNDIKPDYKKAKTIDDYKRIFNQLQEIMPFDQAMDLYTECENKITECENKIKKFSEREALRQKVQQRIDEIDAEFETKTNELEKQKQEENKIISSIEAAQKAIMDSRADIKGIELMIAGLKGIFNSQKKGNYESEIKGLKDQIERKQKEVDVLQNRLVDIQKSGQRADQIYDEINYRKAQVYFEEGLSYDAITIWMKLQNYKNVDNLLRQEEIWDSMHEYLVNECRKPGDLLSFGSYTFCDHKSQLIEWVVIDIKDDMALLISQNALNSMPYSENLYRNWTQCDIRNWLQKEVYEKAFTAKEKGIILPIKNFENPEEEEYVSLLSDEEFSKYSNSLNERVIESIRKCLPTEYAIRNGAEMDSNAQSVWWWLKSPGDDVRRACISSIFGKLDVELKEKKGGGVRPVIWINLKQGY